MNNRFHIVFNKPTNAKCWTLATRNNGHPAIFSDTPTGKENLHRLCVKIRYEKLWLECVKIVELP